MNQHLMRSVGHYSYLLTYTSAYLGAMFDFEMNILAFR